VETQVLLKQKWKSMVNKGWHLYCKWSNSSICG